MNISKTKLISAREIVFIADFYIKSHVFNSISILIVKYFEDNCLKRLESFHKDSKKHMEIGEMHLESSSLKNAN